jgi:DNA-binding LacI/PurR family transcriptional regulator
MKDVAKKAGVTPSIVSRVINNDTKLSIKDETRTRILNAIEELEYRPNVVARSLRLKTTATIAMIVPDITNPFFPELIRGAQKAANEKGFSLILIDTEEDHAREKEYIEILAEKLVDGILLASVYIEDETIDLIHKYNIPYVLVNRTTRNVEGSSVVVDDAYGAALAVEHLVEQGHRKIAHISGLLYTETGLGRLEGYRKILNEHGIAFSSEYIVESKYDEEGGYKAMKKLLSLEKLPTAVFAANDLIAIGAITAMSEQGLKVPDHISIVGFNDIWLAQKVHPPLTTVRFPLYDMGHIASEILIKKIQEVPVEEDKVVLKPELITRQSVRKL